MTITVNDAELCWLRAVAITHLDLLRKQTSDEELKKHEGYQALKSAIKKLN